ncbi:MAG: CYTH domain-containing protein [Patescibacteria group bacterium]|nr:CYTH domain-containing protein [Patescibacteria group bacterium]MDE1965692.1 CYTH domain-containing protein [Patescibacteria group bacterium]
MREYELKFLAVEPEAVEAKLRVIGAAKEKEFSYTLRAFDFPGLPLAGRHAWIRLRTDGTETTLAWKKRLGVSVNDGSVRDEGMEEVETAVGDFETMTIILKNLGLIQKFHQEKKRIRYVKGDIEYDLDTWPLIPPYLEIEGPSEEAAEAAARELGFDPSDAKVCSASQVYRVHGLEVNEYAFLGFEKQVKHAVPLEKVGT